MIKQPCAPSFGCDPEVFVMNTQSGEIVPCVGYLPGTKAEPYHPEWVDDPGLFMQEDNVMCEFNISPQTDSYVASDVLFNARHMVVEELMKHGLAPAWKKVNHKFLQRDLATKQARNIGCEPDMDAYTGGQVRTNVPPLTQWRSCGGHIHLGGDFKCPDFVAALFAELWLSCGGGGVFATPGVDRRAAWYGAPGVYRSKPYGIEYRTPSNKWISSTGNYEWVASEAIRLSTWLTMTPSTDLQRMYRGFPWTELRTWMVQGQVDSDGRRVLLRKARDVGIPL